MQRAFRHLIYLTMLAGMLLTAPAAAQTTDPDAAESALTPSLPAPESTPPAAAPHPPDAPAAVSTAVPTLPGVEGPEKYLTPPPAEAPKEQAEQAEVRNAAAPPEPEQPAAAPEPPEAPQPDQSGAAVQPPAPESAAESPRPIPAKKKAPATIKPALVNKQMHIKVSTGNLRDQASLESKINAQLKKGEAVTVLKRKGDWFRVQLADGETGWVHTSILAHGTAPVPAMAVPPASGKGSTEPIPALQHKSVTVDVGNIRRKPATTAAIIAKVRRGAEPGIAGKKGRWYEVVLADGTRGWAHEILFGETGPEAVSARYQLSGIRVVTVTDSEEKVHFFYNGDQPPKTFFMTTDGPRVVCDFTDTRPDDTISAFTEIGDTMIQSVRVGQRETPDPQTRVVFDLHPENLYHLAHFFEKGLGYTLIVTRQAP